MRNVATIWPLCGIWLLLEFFNLMVNGVFLLIENLDPKKLGENVQMVEKEMEKEVKEGEQKIEKIEEEAEGKLKSK